MGGGEAALLLRVGGKGAEAEGDVGAYSRGQEQEPWEAVKGLKTDPSKNLGEGQGSLWSHTSPGS